MKRKPGPLDFLKFDNPAHRELLGLLVKAREKGLLDEVTRKFKEVLKNE